MTRFIVLLDDDGIRPAGPPDSCFYCRAKVGEMHDEECVTIRRAVVYEVVDLEGSRLALVKTEDPFSWDVDALEFHKNESSWCANNALAFEALEASERWKALQSTDHGGNCACGVVRFRVHLMGSEAFREPR